MKNTEGIYTDKAWANKTLENIYIASKMGLGV